MKKLLALVGIGVFGYVCVWVGRIDQTAKIGVLYRRTELGDESAIELMERLSDSATGLDEALTRLAKTIRR